jgi:hypothetical protein
VPYPSHPYWPSLTEISIFAAAVAAFCLGFMIFAKFFPIISIWEIEEGRETAVRDTSARISSYLPDDSDEALVEGDAVTEGAG